MFTHAKSFTQIYLPDVVRCGRAFASSVGSKLYGIECCGEEEWVKIGVSGESAKWEHTKQASTVAVGNPSSPVGGKRG